MPYLSLNGVTVSVAAEGASLALSGVSGEEARSASGELVGGPLESKREWNMSTPPVTPSEVDAWVGLIEGRGHNWPFDADLYSARGRGPSSGTATIINVGSKRGTGHVRVATGDTVTWAAQLGAAWTTLHWRFEAGAWKNYLCRSDGARWVNGVRDDTSMGGLSVSSGSLSLTGAAFLNDFDDVVGLPFAAPDAWIASLYAQHNAEAWSELPRVLAAGSFNSSSLSLRGRVTDSRLVRCAPAGALTTAYALQFTLREV
jgi:hypothetical protein